MSGPRSSSRRNKPPADASAPAHPPACGDPVRSNTSHVLLDAVGEDVLRAIAGECLDLLQTAVTVHEANGDCAATLVNAGWRRMLDRASRDLCAAADSAETLPCGGWRCLASCWHDAARTSVETGGPIDTECPGGLRLYAAPIVAAGEIVGAISLGYGEPPQEEERLAQLSERYGVPLESLRGISATRPAAPAFLVGLAKKRLRTAARLIGEMVQRKRTEDALRRRTRELEILSRASQEINRVLEAPAILRALVYAGMELTDAAAGCFGPLVDGELWFQEYFSDGRVAPVDYRFSPQRGVPGWVWHTGQPYVTNDAANDPHVIPDIQRALGFRTLIDLPIRDRRGELLGCIELHDKRGDEGFTERDVRLLQTLAASAATALENARALDERRRAEEALRHQFELTDTIARSAPDPLFMVDENGAVTYLNPAAEMAFGWPRAELLGRNLHDAVHHTHADGAPYGPADCLLTQAAMSGRAVRNHEDVLLHRSGRLIPVSCSMAPIAKDGQRAGAVLVVHDITERKRLEREQEASRAQIGELNVRLQRAMKETHHRVKNNLQVITAMVDMRLMDCAKEVSTEELRRLGLHVSTLAAVHEILTAEAEHDHHASSISAEEILARLLPLLQQMAGARRVRFELDDARLTARQGTSLALVANELVSNAIKHASGDVLVRFEADVAQGQGTLEVLDDGPGFASGFQALHAAHTGLELVENLSRWDLGGSVRYGSRPEGGGAVRVTLPLTPIESD